MSRALNPTETHNESEKERPVRRKGTVTHHDAHSGLDVIFCVVRSDMDVPMKKRRQEPFLAPRNTPTRSLDLGKTSVSENTKQRGAEK